MSNKEIALSYLRQGIACDSALEPGIDKTAT